MNTNQKIRWGFLGSGLVANDVAEDFALVADAEIAAVCSRTQQSAKHFAEKFNIPKIHESLEAMLNDDDLDIIYIATPHHLHKAQSLSCLRSGKAVVCEKPFAINAAEAATVIKEARNRNLFCMEAMWMRFFPLIQNIKTRIDQGELGDIRLMSADFGYPTHYDPENRFFNANAAGGSLLDRGIYPLSLAQYLLGNPDKITSTAHIGKSGVDEQSSCLIHFKSGAIATLSSTLCGLGSNQAVITGDKGRLQIHEPFYRPDTLSFYTAEQPSSATVSQQDPGIKGKIKQNPTFKKLKRLAANRVKKLLRNKFTSMQYAGNGYQFEITEATRCMKSGLTESPIMPLNDTLEVLNIMDQMRADWKQNQQVKG